MNNFSIKNVLKKNVMTIALFVIYVAFTIATGGNMFSSSNVTSLIEQNAYVFILGVGMLNVKIALWVRCAEIIYKHVNSSLVIGNRIRHSGI